MTSKRRKLDVDPRELLDRIRDAVRDAYGDDCADQYDPLVQIALVGANERLPMAVRFAANREVASYLYPKRRAIEVDSDQGGVTVQLVQFSKAGSDVVEVLDRPTPEPSIIDALPCIDSPGDD